MRCGKGEEWEGDDGMEREEDNHGDQKRCHGCGSGASGWKRRASVSKHKSSTIAFDDSLTLMFFFLFFLIKVYFLYP